MKLLSKKGELKRILMILAVVIVLFMGFAGWVAFAETTEEEKARLEAELAEIEQRLAVISAGFGVNEVGL